MSTRTRFRFVHVALWPLLGLAAACGATDSSAPAWESSELEFEASASQNLTASEGPVLEQLGRYATGIVGFASSGETAALRRNRLFVTSAEAALLDVVDVSDPSSPSLVQRVDLTAYGSAIQSVDISSRSLAAVAVSGASKVSPGSIVFLDMQGNVVRTASVGSLPDMVAFSPDGKKLVVANEGEPDCYGPGCTDPLGSVSIIDVHPLKPALPVTTLTFDGVPLPAGVRIFGPGASPAQDLEPEYLTISEDNRRAYVTLQENNALAVIDLWHNQVETVRALGYKDFSTAPQTQVFEFKQLPAIGKTAAGQQLQLGGFSGLCFEGRSAHGKLKFITNTDRGPNAEPTGVQRPFLLPAFTPRLVRFELEPKSGKIEITQIIELKRADGTPLTGLPNTAVAGGAASTAHNDEVAVDLFGNVLGLDPLGGDFEGIVVDQDGSFWLPDEYRPAIYHFDPTGRLLTRLVPQGAHAAAGLPVPMAGAAGELGVEALPGVLGQRRQNRGFEALTLQKGKLYAFVQSPLRNPATLGNSALAALQNVRVVEIDPSSLATRQFIYMLDNAPSVSAADTRADKIGDATALPGRGFLVVERDDDALPEAAPSTISKKIYAFDLSDATDISSKDTLYAGKSLDQMTKSELAAVGVKPLNKVLHVDLVAAGYANVAKVEGLALVDATTVAVINDNDFQVAGSSIDPATGTFSSPAGYIPEPVLLGLIKTQGLDASDRDNVINIRDWPVYGMYQPDGVASFRAGGKTYLLTANEGDARDYPGFAEEARAKSLAAKYPGLPVANDAELGRLTVTVAPPAGDLSRPYVFGARSFSVWNADSGALVWDSGAELELRTAMALPSNFNANNEANDFDSRSDNKGPEPEGIAVGTVRGRNYAFVGLERIGGVAVYDVSDPARPTFVDYVNNRDFSGPVGPDSGPEVVRFVPASESPNHEPLLVLSNEITGTVSLWRFNPR